MRDLFATLFFVSIGMLIDPLFIAGHLGAVLGLAAFIMVAKAIVTLFVLLPFRLGGKTTAFTALGMIQIGEFSYVLASAGQEVGAISTELNNLILAASVVSIICTPAAFWIAPRVDLFLARLPLLGRLLAAPVATTVVDHPLAEHAIVVGYGRVGRRVVEGLQQAGLPLAVVEQDLRLVQELAAEGVSALYGDASYASVLAAAQPGRARLIVVALPDSGATRATVLNARRANPTAPILARAARPDDDAALRRAGATAVILPELAGALVLLEESLLAIGLPATPAADELHAAVTRG
jgi:CPA2 family monovalent cation:H+ antiporter-2